MVGVDEAAIPDQNLVARFVETSETPGGVTEKAGREVIVPIGIVPGLGVRTDVLARGFDQPRHGRRCAWAVLGNMGEEFLLVEPLAIEAEYCLNAVVKHAIVDI